MLVEFFDHNVVHDGPSTYSKDNMPDYGISGIICCGISARFTAFGFCPYWVCNESLLIRLKEALTALACMATSQL